MFPHNSSSHEISTETNAFVQNSKGDVVVLEGSSLSGAREGERPEHARYCDIEFINSSMMAAPISHPEATAANDFLTVLPRQSGELSFAGVGEACQSVATETTKNPTNHLLTYDNNNKVNNHNNAEHNHHKYRKQNTPGSLGQQLGSSADTSKSTCKPLSDNKDSFSDVSVRVLKVSVRVVVTRGDARRPAGVPSLVRIPKSDRPQRLPRLANFVDNYSLLGSRLDHGENNNFKANLSFVSNNNNNSKSVILLSSTSYGDYYLLADGGLAGADAAIPVILVDEINTSDRSRGTKLIGDKSSTTTTTTNTTNKKNKKNSSNNNNNNTATSTITNTTTTTSSSLVVPRNTNSRIVRRLIDDMTRKLSLESVNYYEHNNKRNDGISRIESLNSLLRSLSSLKSHFEGGVVVVVVGGTKSENSSSVSAHARNFTANLASSSITLIVSKNGITDHTLQSFLDNLTKVRAMSPLTTKTTSLLGHVTVSKLTQRICVPLLIKYKGYDYNNVGNNNDDVYDCHDVIVVFNDDEDCDDDGDDDDDDDDNDYCNDNCGRKIVVAGQDDEMMNISNNNPDVIEDIVNVAVCYKTSSIMTTNISMLGSQNDGIRRTEATMFTVGALSFQDNDKSNKPLNASFKDNKYQVSTKVGLESNSTYIKSVSKSTPSDKSSDKSETSHEEARLGVTDEDEMKVEVKRVRSAVNIPTLTTCEPTMTLKCQSATVTSQTNAVPVSQVENNPNNDYDYDYDDDDDDDDDVHQDVEHEIIQQQEPHRSKRSTFVRGDNKDLSVEYIPPRDADHVHPQISTVNLHNFDDNTKNTECFNTNSTRCFVDQCEKKLALHDELINHRDIDCKSNDDDIEATIMSTGLTNEKYKNDDNVTEEINDQDGQTWSSTRNWSRLIAHVRALIPAYQKAYKNNESECEIRRNELKNALSILFRTDSSQQQQQQKHEQFNSDPIIEYKLRWGIPTMLRLCGGGESSLNSGGGATWGSAAATTPNNNNANQSGWGGTPGNPPGSAGPPSNWGGNNINRSVTGNPNSNQNQGPPGAQTNPGNVTKVNNPNQSGNAQTGPPTSQSSNPTQSNQNSGGQWSQGKPNSALGPGGPNPSAQNNNGNNVPQQPAGSNANNNQVNNPAQGTVPTAGTVVATNPSTKAQLEQLNTMREALFSQDGWGCQHVNQDTNWDVPASPEPALTKDGVPMWKPPVNNGTDLWEANLRNGGQPPPSQQAKTPWGHTPSTNIGGTWGEDDDAADSSNMWTGAPAPSQPNTTQWPGGGGNQAGSSWVDPRIDPRDPRDLRSVDPREMRDPRENRMTLDPRDHMRVMDPMAGRDPRMTDMRGDPRGISGRLNGANADAMWGLPPGPPHHQMGHQQHPSGGPPAKMLNPSSMNQWAAPPPKDMLPGKPSGWEEPSPPTQRRNVPNYDDGTSLWGNPAANQRAMPGTKVSHWKDLPTSNIGRGGMQCPPGMPQNRMPGQPGMKPEVSSGPMWGHPGGPGGRNGSWVDGPHDATTWDDPKTPAAWNEPQLNPATWGGPGAHKSKAMGGPGAGSWADADMDSPTWSHPSKPALTKEVIWNSREFRYLCDLGYKKEDVEVALRTREMNRDEAQELLSQLRSLDQWRRHDAQSAYDPTSQANTAVAYPRFNHVAQQMSFPPASRTLQNPPSTQQLRMLVQQIQLAVQEGYLNQQILNQPLAPPTLLLLNQLLQQIKVLQQLHQQHSVQNSLKGNSQTVLQISVQITKTKQQIANLQNQIAVQQATYMKQQQQQQQQQQHPTAPSQSSEYYKTSSVHDPMSALQNSFSDLAMNKEPPVSQQQSRLNQWKLPSLDKDGDITANEFSRAPGTTSKPLPTPGTMSHSHSSPNMNPLLGQGDGTWSSRLGDSGWPDAGNSDATDGKDWQPGGTAFTDLVPEFEPGKPWKMKNIEDDPSITPGSVVRSLSLAAIKDPDAIFSSSSKTSPPPQSVNADTSIPSLSNSTWSFNPPATTPSAFTSSKNAWTDPTPPTYSELWGVPLRVRGPPPGLGSKSAGWTSGTWLLLKNLTPQIDGSTLKTLCMQHGPVLDFRLYLNHGIALTKYSTRDEATKAQGALNNCVLGNTTIFAESPVDNEAHTLLHTLSHGGGGGQQQTGGSGNSGWAMRPSKKAGPPPDTWSGSSSQLWGAPPSSNSLWSNSGIDSSDTQRTTPSSLNLYLPGDLLGGRDGIGSW